MARRYAFGTYTLETSPLRLLRDGLPVEAPMRSVELLAALVERPGVVFRREDLFARVWPGSYVSDETLFDAFRKLRIALDDSPRAPTWIESIPGVGYRFLGEVEVDGAATRPRLDGPLAPPGPFVGRDAELAALREGTTAGPGVWWISGGGGIGKTRLARELTRDVAAPTVWVDLQPATTPSGLRAAASRAVRGAADRLADAFGALGDAIVVVDHVDHVVGPLRVELEAWRAAAPRARFVLTSRAPVAAPGVNAVPLAPLGLPPAKAPLDALHDHAASRLLLLLAGDSAGYLPTAEEAPAIIALVQLLGGLPLAIELAAPRMRILRPKQLFDRASQHLNVLGGALGGRTRHDALRAALAMAWDLLGLRHRHALAKLAQLPGPFPLEVAEAALVQQGAVLLGDLVDHGLVRRIERDRPLFSLPAPVREFVAERVAPDEAVYDALLTWYATPGLVGSAPGAALVHSRDEAPNLALALDRALAQRQGVVAVRVLRNFAPTLLADGPLGAVPHVAQRIRALGSLPAPEDGWVALLEAEAALGVEPARHTAALIAYGESNLDREAAGEARAFTLQIELDQRRGATAEAIKLADASARHPGLVGAARVRWCVAAARVYPLAGRSDDAEARLDDALTTARELRDDGLVAVVLAERGALRTERGQGPSAKQDLEQALALAAGVPDAAVLTRVRERAGAAALRLGQLAEAETLLTHALDGYTRAGNQVGVLVCVDQLGRVGQMRGDATRGGARLEEAIRIAHKLGFQNIEAVARGNLGQLYGQLGRLDEAETELLAALDLQLALKIRAPTVLHNLGAVAAAKGAFSLARERFEGALAAYRSAGNKRGLAITTAALGELETKAGRYTAAISALTEAHAALRSAGDRMAAVQVGGRLGTAHALAGDLPSADAMFALTLVECRNVGLREQEADTLARQARAALHHGQRARAKTELANAKAVAATLRPAPAGLTAELAAIERELG